MHCRDDGEAHHHGGFLEAEEGHALEEVGIGIAVTQQGIRAEIA